MELDNAKQIESFVREAREAYYVTRQELGRAIYRNMLYDDGVQWLADTTTIRGYSGLKQALAQSNLETGKIRAVVNRINRFVSKVSTRTRPSNFSIEGFTPVGMSGAQATEIADVLQRSAEVVVDSSGLLGCAQDANVRRSLAGQWGLGYRLQRTSRGLKVGDAEMEMPDKIMRAFDFNPVRLTLDPFNESRDLRQHDYVIFSDVFTKTAIARQFGLALDDDDLKTVGELTPIEQEFYTLSRGRLFHKYRTYSKTKGAIVHEVYVRDSTGNFSERHVMIEQASGKQMKMAEPEENPYGGDGLPFVLLRGRARGEGHIDMSDVDFMRDDQDRLNHAETITLRMLVRNSGHHWIADKKFFGRNASDEDVRSKFSNQVGGVIVGDSSGRTDLSPKLMPTPPLPTFLQDLATKREEAMKEQNFLADGSFGATKSHVPDASFQRALDEADSVHSARVEEDITRAYEPMIYNMLGTAIKQLKRSSPSAAAMFRRVGFAAPEFSALISQDERNPSVDLKLRQSSVRYRSQQAKRNDLDFAVQVGSIDPAEHALAMGSDLDLPVTVADQDAIRSARRAALAIVNGENWEPLDLSPRLAMAYVREFEKAILDPKIDPEARMRLNEAIGLQRQFTLPPPEPGQAQAQPQPELPPEATIAQALSGQFALPSAG